MSVEQSVTVLLGTCKNLRSSRGDVFTLFAQVLFGKTLLGESSRLECKIEESSCPINLEVKHTLKISEPHGLDELARSPLLVNVYEVLPKDKKSKEEKTQLVGNANVDLLPLLQGHASIEKNLKLSPISAVSPPGDEGPEIDVTISLPRPLLTPEDIEKSNILSLRVKALYSLPEAWSPSQGSTFTVATPRPQQLSTEGLSALSITGGEIKTAGDVDLPQKMGHWKWAELNPTTSGLASLTTSPMEINAVEDESGQLTSSESVNFRRTVESRKPRVIWNSELRAYLPPSCNSSFLSHLSRAPVWPIEVVRVTSTVKGKGKEEEISLSHHGVAYVDLSSLLYPGNTRIFGVYCIEGLDEIELAEKTNDGHTKSIMDLVHKYAVGSVNALKKSTLNNKRPSTALKTSVISMASISQPEEAGTAKPETTSSAYIDARSYIMLEILLAQPLVPKRPALVIAEKISEYIPPRPAIPRRLGGVEKAIMDFHGATADVAGLLLSDYRSLFGSVLEESGVLPNSNEDFEERKRELLYTLNTSGRYHAYKEHMKKSVVSLVREKFLNEANTKNEEEKQAFLSQLYTYLVDEMHNALGKVFSLEDSSPSPPTIVDSDMLREYAREAELLVDLEKAEYYHKELLTREQHIALHWYDYGVYYLLKGDTEHSEQCLKEAVSLDQQFVPALLLYGMCCSLEEKFKEAEEMMELATTVDSNNIIAWTMRGLCYELSNNGLYRDMCYKEANKLSCSDGKKTYIKPISKQKQSKELCESEDTNSQRSTGQPLEHQETEQLLEPDTETKQEVVTAAEELTEMDSKQMAAEDDTEKETKVANVEKLSKPSERLSPFLQTAAYLLDVYATKYAEMCLAHERLLHAKSDPDPVVETSTSQEKPEDSLTVDYHISVARLNMLKEEYNTAISHLTMAVKEDILNSNAWALLGHCHYMIGNMTEAKDCYERVVEYVVQPAHINVVLLRLADVYMKDKEYSKAKKVYLRSCKAAPSNTTWRGVGIACYMLENYSEAEDALSEANILNNLDPITWAYIALVCHKTKRDQEATQALNFAIKTGLTDTALIQELQVK